MRLFEKEKKRKKSLTKSTSRPPFKKVLKIIVTNVFVIILKENKNTIKAINKDYDSQLEALK